jgi:UDP-glucose 4-epimerase
VRNGLPPVIFGDGSAARDFTYVTETAAGIVAAGESRKTIGRTLNLAFGSPHTVAEVADTVLRVCGRSDLQPDFLDPRPGDVQHLHADVSLARHLIGFQARVSLHEGIKNYLDWVVRHRPDPVTTLDPEVVNWRMPKAAAHE